MPCYQRFHEPGVRKFTVSSQATCSWLLSRFSALWVARRSRFEPSSDRSTMSSQRTCHDSLLPSILRLSLLTQDPEDIPMSHQNSSYVREIHDMVSHSHSTKRAPRQPSRGDNPLPSYPAEYQSPEGCLLGTRVWGGRYASNKAYEMCYDYRQSTSWPSSIGTWPAWLHIFKATCRSEMSLRRDSREEIRGPTA